MRQKRLKSLITCGLISTQIYSYFFLEQHDDSDDKDYGLGIARSLRNPEVDLSLSNTYIEKSPNPDTDDTTADKEATAK